MDRWNRKNYPRSIQSSRNKKRTRENTSCWQRFDAVYFIKFLTGRTPLERGRSIRHAVSVKRKKKKRKYFSRAKWGEGEREKIKRAALAPGTAHGLSRHLSRRAPENDRIVPREESICPRFPRRFRVINRHASLFVAFTRQLSTCEPSDRFVE